MLQTGGSAGTMKLKTVSLTTKEIVGFYVEEEVKIILDRVISDSKEQERCKQEEKEREERSKREEREREERMAREARQHELELRKLDLLQQNQPLNDESGRRVEIFDLRFN
ncbi:hypothetical protein TNCV_1191981 [Trichonephila clavipes]|nr:hypothetical protein TNCV_1191981 [Trichonephila clavipes]